MLEPNLCTTMLLKSWTGIAQCSPTTDVGLKFEVACSTCCCCAYGHTALPAETLHFDSGRVVGAKCTLVHPALLERNLEIGPAIEALGSPPMEGFLGRRPSSGSCKLPRH